MENKTKDKNNLKEELKEKLREIFQFENEDLDFGIYRIMNYKRKEIDGFIEKELIDEIKKQLDLAGEEETIKLRDEFEKINQKIKETFGINAIENGELKEEFKNTPLGKEYYEKKRQLEEIRVSEDLEREIYNHLINFFSRYCDKGDFISKRRYGKNEKYIVPYNGEEVLLYWANKDQYYIKTTEYFRRYTFKVKELIVNFRVIEAEEEKGNIKSSEKKFFVLNEKVFDFDERKRELNIYFDYSGLTEEEEEKYKSGNSISQDKINEEIIKILKEKIPQNSLVKAIFEKEGDKTLIEKHLYRYTRRNTTNYFIHKNLKEFLERELDFYIKNEFLNLEDLQVLDQSEYFDKLRLYLIGVSAFRNIALKIIEFLAQIENFQKKIWEKKKFVIDTNYVITLDKIKEYAGEEFLESILDYILKNKKQLEEWKELFGIEVKDKKYLITDNALQGKEWKKLPIDTRYFDEEFKWKLLVALTEKNNLDEILDGILIKSENWQALNLLLNKYYEKVQTIYIDPPFNKGQEADFLYKVGYEDNTWITMLENRISLAKYLLKDTGSIFVRCDYNGNYIVRSLMNEIFGEENFRNEIAVSRTKTALYIGTPKKLSKNLGSSYDNIYWYSKFSDISFPKISQGIIEITRGAYWKDLKSFYDRPNYRYELLGILPEEGCSWVWKKEDVLSAIENYNQFTKNYEEKIKEIQEVSKIIKKKLGEKASSTFEENIINALIEEYWNKTNRILRFVKRGKNTFYYWVEPIQRVSITDWTSIEGYARLWKFSTENSEALLRRVIESTSNQGDFILDFFLGSGTTTAVAHKLHRKWLGVEMGDHFYTVVLPRMKKVLAYDPSGISKEKDVKENYNEDKAGGFFKYHILEQYEDALENIEFEESKKTLLELQDYFVKYTLDWETKESKTFLDINEIKDPFNYKLKIMEDYQQKLVNVDLIKTFNYLLGLNVSKYKILQGNERKYIFVFGEKNGKRMAIVWRSIKDIDLEKDKEIVENSIRYFNPDEIYINGDAVVKGFRAIEPLFKSLMFEGD